MTDAEKARVKKYEETGDADEAKNAARAKAIDAAPQDKMVNAPSKKK